MILRSSKPFILVYPRKLWLASTSWNNIFLTSDCTIQNPSGNVSTQQLIHWDSNCNTLSSPSMPCPAYMCCTWITPSPSPFPDMAQGQFPKIFVAREIALVAQRKRESERLRRPQWAVDRSPSCGWAETQIDSLIGPHFRPRNVPPRLAGRPPSHETWAARRRNIHKWRCIIFVIFFPSLLFAFQLNNNSYFFFAQFGYFVNPTSVPRCGRHSWIVHKKGKSLSDRFGD